MLEDLGSSRGRKVQEEKQQKWEREVLKMKEKDRCEEIWIIVLFVPVNQKEGS